MRTIDYWPALREEQDGAEKPTGVPGKVTLTQQIQRRATRTAPDAAGPAVGTVLEAGASGAGLPTAARSRLEASLGTNLSDVRVHTDPQAAAAADELGARAFTTGRDIYFAAGQYRPDDPFGMHLLAHEVAHTVQQGSSSPGVQTKLEVSEPGDASEIAADAFADHVVHGGPAPALGTAPARTLHRAPAAGGAPAANAPNPSTTPNVGNPQLATVMAEVARTSKRILDQIASMLGVQASEAGVVAEADIYAFWSQVLGGADDKAWQVTQHIDAATRSALAALTLAKAKDASVSNTDAALTHLVRAKDRFADARAALADERNATIAGAQIAIKTCEVTIDMLISAAGRTMAAQAELVGLSKAAQIGIDAGVRFALAGGAKASTQLASGQKLNVNVLVAAISAAIDAGASGLTKEVAKTFGKPLAEFLKGALAGTAAQMIKELWGVAAKSLEGKDPPGFTEALVKVVVSGIAGGVEFGLKANGLLPPSLKPVGNAGSTDRFLLMLENLVVQFDLPQEFLKQTSNKAMLDFITDASKKTIDLFVAASKAPGKTPVVLDGPDGVAAKVNELKYAIARYEGEQGNVPEGGVPVSDAGTTASSDTCGPRGQALLQQLDRALEQQAQPHYRTLPLTNLRELVRLTSWIRDARRILQLANETATTGVELHTKWDVALFRRVIERSERLVQESRMNGGRDVAVGANGDEYPVSKATATAVIDELRGHLLQIPVELQPGPTPPGGGAAGQRTTDRSATPAGGRP